MRIFSKKAFLFQDPHGQEPNVTVQFNSFADVPDWVQDTLIFKWAVNDADIQVMTSPVDVAKVEKSDGNLQQSGKRRGNSEETKSEASGE